MTKIQGSVPITGLLAPGDSEDLFAVTDTIYGIDGLRNLSGGTSELSNIPEQRRRPGMIVGVVESSVRTYYKLNSSPWSMSISDWTKLPLLNYSGSTSFINNEGQELTCASTTNWDLSSGKNAYVTLTENTTLNISNVSSFNEGVLVVTQDGTGGRTISLPPSSFVSNNGGGAVTLTSSPGGVDKLKFHYLNSKFYWDIKTTYS